MFATLGVRVTIVEKRPRLLEFADTEMVEALTYNMRDRRVTMRLNEEVDSVEELPDGRVAAMLVSNKRVIGDALLYAVGRQGNVDGRIFPRRALWPMTAAAFTWTPIIAPRSRTFLRWAT